MIQGSINQLLSMSAVIARMDPNLEQRTQLRQTEQKMKGLKKQTEAIGTSDLQEMPEAEIAFENKLADQIVKTSEERFQLKPTEENLTKHRGNIKGAEEFKAAGQQELDRRAAAQKAEADRQAAAIQQELDRRAAAQRAEADRMAAEELRQKELAKVREALLANAPAPRGGIKHEYK